MLKPNGYEDVQTGEYTPIELGGHHAIIKQVKEQVSSTGKNMIVVVIDFADNDKQPKYFSEQFANDVRPEKKWPYQAIQYIVVESQDGKTSKSFKSFITAFEKSNNCEATWGDKFCDQFKNKKIGVVYGNVEEEYNGEIKKRRRIRWFAKDDGILDANIPIDKLISSGVKPNADGFNSISANEAEEIPF